jgi:polysaccharide pyruvyl transferase WcaK-like protein
MKVLVTGLCLSRNLGGPAMGLTLMKELNKKFPEAIFTFAVDYTAYEAERKWAKYYNVEIVKRDKLVAHLVSKFRLREIIKFSLSKTELTQELEQIHREFMTAYRNSDIVIDMSGISYVGDGVRGPLEGLRQYSFFYYAKKTSRPFIRFIQSFGPFNDWRVRIFAKNEFRQLDFVFARGKKSAGYCRELVTDKSKVFDFPDTAILLPTAEEKWLNEYLKSKKLVNKGYTILSPSAVIYNLPKNVKGSIGKKHLESFVSITRSLLDKGETIFLLPHMYSDEKSESDRELCYLIQSELKEHPLQASHIKVMDEDLDPMQAKALIKASKMAIVSRYHALVAAASTQTPVITLGWNIKYLDLLEYYNLQSMAIDVRDHEPQTLCGKVIERIDQWSEVDLNVYFGLHKENIQKVESAFQMLIDWIKKHVDNK